MHRDLISRLTRNAFREVLSGLVLREIDDLFHGAGFQMLNEHAVNVQGMRRSRVEAYYARIDFSNPNSASQLAIVFAEVLRTLWKRARGGEQWAGEKAEELVQRMETDGFSIENGAFSSVRLQLRLVDATTVVDASLESVHEHILKARNKIEAGDFAGAIASAYTLLEELLKALLRRTGTHFTEDEGDVRILYKAVIAPLNLNPAGPNLESYLKAVLQGLKEQVSGLYEAANKASDRHARRYNPQSRHAKLVVNSVFTLAEFLVETCDEREKKTRAHD